MKPVPAYKTFAEINKMLEAHWPVHLARTAYTLDYMMQLMDHLGNPQEKLKVVHVAGTSGKTSTVYYIAALLHEAGKRVGHAASPHVYELNERVQIDLMPLDEPTFCRDFSEFMKLLDGLDFTPTFFEMLTAFMYWEFVRLQVEYAVVEVGLGGLLDATNVVHRTDKVAVITDIGLDHMHKLGNTVAEIALHKAGIIQLHNAVFCYRQAAEIMAAIEERAASKQADLHVLDPQHDQVTFMFLPAFQDRNFGLALRVVQYVLERDSLPALDDARTEQAAHTYVPGRMETVTVRGRQLILDGAHNAQKMHAFVQSIEQRYPGQKRAALVSFIARGDVRFPAVIKELAPHVNFLIATSYDGSVDPQKVAAACHNIGFMNVTVIPDMGEALDALLKRPEPVLFTAGSLHMIGHLQPFIKRLTDGV